MMWALDSFVGLGSALSGGLYLKYLTYSLGGFLVGSRTVFANIYIMPMAAGTTSVMLYPDGPGDYYFDWANIRSELRLQPYVIQNQGFTSGDTPFFPGYTSTIDGFSLAYGWIDQLPASTPGPYYSPITTNAAVDVIHYFSVSGYNAAGVIPDVPWFYGTTLAHSRSIAIDLNAQSLTALPGSLGVDGAAVIFTPSTPENPLYVSKVPPVVHAIPPAPTQTKFPIAPWTRRSGKPFREES